MCVFTALQEMQEGA